jgi:molybdopterin-guanine dinucleotide biosynthesis protein A
MQNPHNEKNSAIHPYPDVTGVLLAGGKSRRMGRDKALLEVFGEPMFRRTLRLLEDLFSTVVIAGDRPDLAPPGILAVADIYPGSALGGLHTGLHSATTEWIFVVPCDMPCPDPRIMRLLLQHREGFDAVVPRTAAGYEPVFALYHKNCLPHMEEMLRNDQFRIYDFYQRIKIRYLDETQLPEGWQKALFNINTPEDFNRIKKEQ